jgi:hypothetical protein
VRAVNPTTRRPGPQERTRPPRALPPDPGLDRALEDPEQSSGAKLVLVCLVRRWAWSKPSCWPSNATLSKVAGFSVGHTRRLLAELEARGFLRREMTDDVPGGRRLVLVWRAEPIADALPPCAPKVAPPCAPPVARKIVDVGKIESERVEAKISQRPRQDPATSRPSAPITAEPIKPPVPVALPPTVVLSTEEADRLAALPDASRDRVLTWLTMGDPLLTAEARKMLQPPRASAPPPVTTRELLERLREDPANVMMAAQALSIEFSDAKSFAGYRSRLEEVWRGKVSTETLLDAFRQASGPKCRNRGAVWMTAMKRG